MTRNNAIFESKVKDIARKTMSVEIHQDVIYVSYALTPMVLEGHEYI